MHDRQDTFSPQQTNPHPRRPPAHKSVSLRHSPPAGLPSKAPSFRQSQTTSLGSSNAPASDQANPPSSHSPRLQSNKHSSGESSDAGKWFDTANAQKSNASFADSQCTLCVISCLLLTRTRQVIHHSSSVTLPRQKHLQMDMDPAVTHRQGRR
jgi:hypothetical protein